MTIKSQGGIFGRNPTFNNVAVEGNISVEGNVDVEGSLDVTGTAKVNSFIAGATSTPQANVEIKDATGGELRLSTSEPSMVANDVAGKITWNAPDEGSGTQANIVAGEISLIATNFWDATKYTPSAIVFKTCPLNGPAIVEAARFNSSGNLAFPSGQGIDFSATSNSSGTTTSELFDDYEEGVWTPTYVPESGSFSSITYDPNTSGNYTKVGNTVYIAGSLRTDAISVGTASGRVYIGGLPFSVGSSNYASGGITVYQSNLFTGEEPASADFVASGTTAGLLYRTAADGPLASETQVSDLGTGANNNILRFFGFYFV